MTVTINGQQRRLERPLSLLDLLGQLELDPQAVVVEHNRQIVRRAELSGRTVTDGDRIELVHFVGGG